MREGREVSRPHLPAVVDRRLLGFPIGSIVLLFPSQFRVPRSELTPPHSSWSRSPSVIMVKPLAPSVSMPISMLSTISATAGLPRGRTSSG